jgi:hypothetical protein
MKLTIESFTSTITVEAIAKEIWTTAALSAQLGAHDLTVDATGNAAYTDHLSATAVLSDIRTSLVAVALHRQGRIGRVRIQISNAAPIFQRSSAAGFPVITALPVDEPALRWETGCGAAVNNAPPWAVSAAAALAAHTVVEVLARRMTDDLDLVDVYEPSDPPFDHRGMQELRPTGA